MKKDKKEITEITDISVYIAALSRVYRPAPTPADATHFFSTEEVIEAICDINPGAKINKEQVFEALRNAHYNFCNRPGAIGLQFKWMMRER